MTDSRWQRLDDLFARLADAPAEEQCRVLDEECADDPELRREIEALLDADTLGATGLRGLVDQAAESAGADGGQGVEQARTGERIGPYALIRLLGEGGMGAVYLAERADDVYQGQVAIKLLRPTLFRREAEDRFRAERQILADLRHPNIARLLDGGTTAEGMPYLVMEYVEGEPLDSYCDARGLSVEERIALFRKVCGAVQYAHGRLVVHRDLKPANVMVGDDGEPRLLDFGIAKLLDDGGDRGGLTRTGVRPMTPAYASPEQVMGEPVTTSTDVYALGVLLYRLLTGRLPYPEGVSDRKLEAAVLEHAPEAPGTVAHRMATGAGDGGVATRRAAGIGPDLDTVVLKALQKEPERRYESVEAFSQDLRRYLEGRPVVAQPDTWAYRTGKFVRRNRGLVLGSTASVLAIVAFAVSSAVQSVQLERQRDAARLERDKARAVTDFLIEVFDATDPNQAQGLEITAREILGTGGARVREELADQPEVQAEVMIAIGEAYRRLAGYDSARAFFEGAVARTRDTYGEVSDEHARALLRLGVTQRQVTNYDEAERLARRVVQIRTELEGDDGLGVAEAVNNLALVQSNRGAWEESVAGFTRALEIREARLPPDHPDILTTLGNLGSVYTDMGRHDEAAAFLERALSGRRALHQGRDHMDVAFSTNNLGSALEYAGRLEEAEPYYLESLAIRERLLEPDHPMILTVKNNLAGLYLARGDVGRAVELFQEVVEVRRRVSEGMALAMALNNYGVALLRNGDLAQAEPVLVETAQAIRAAEGAESPMVSYPVQTLGDVSLQRGDSARAEARFREAVRLRRDAWGADNPNTAISIHKLGQLLLDLGRLGEAQRYLEEAMAIRDRILEKDHPDRLDSVIMLARLRLAQGDDEAARTLLDEELEAATAALGEEDPQVQRMKSLRENASP